MGECVIENLPTGRWKFHIWHERTGPIKEATRNGFEEKWPDGIMEVEIIDGEMTDLGTFRLKL